MQLWNSLDNQIIVVHVFCDVGDEKQIGSGLRSDPPKKGSLLSTEVSLSKTHRDSLEHVCCFLHHVCNIFWPFELDELTEQSQKVPWFSLVRRGPTVCRFLFPPTNKNQIINLFNKPLTRQILTGLIAVMSCYGN